MSNNFNVNYSCNQSPSIGRSDSEKIRQLEEQFQNLQSTLYNMNKKLHEESQREGISGGNGLADAAQPGMRETIHSIQTKLNYAGQHDAGP